MKQPDDRGAGEHTNLRGINPLERAYQPQCEAVKVHCSEAAEQPTAT